MKLKLEKFGTTSITRELGSEAFKALQPTLRELPQGEELEIDFSGILKSMLVYPTHSTTESIRYKKGPLGPKCRKRH